MFMFPLKNLACKGLSSITTKYGIKYDQDVDNWTHKKCTIAVYKKINKTPIKLV